MNFLLSFLAAIIASIIDWQKDKSSWKIAWTQNWIKYLSMFASALIITWLAQWEYTGYLFVLGIAALVYFFFTFLSNVVKNLFKKKP